MRRAYIQYALVTVKRPTYFLTPSGERTEELSEAWIGNQIDAVKFRDETDEPKAYDLIKVTVSAEV